MTTSMPESALPEHQEGGLRLTVPVRVIGICLLTLAATLAVGHLVVHTLAELDVITFEGRLVKAFDMDEEVSIPTWVSVMLLMGIAVVLTLVAAGTRDRAQRRWWIVFAVGFVVLSLDEGAALHESLMYATRNLLGITGGPFWYAWVIPVGIALLIMAPFVIRFVLSLPRRTCIMLLASAAVYATGAIGVEIVSATAGAEIEAFERDEDDSAVWLMACVEESLEIFGLVLMMITSLLHLRDYALRGRPLAVSVD